MAHFAVEKDLNDHLPLTKQFIAVIVYTVSLMAAPRVPDYITETFLIYALKLRSQELN